MMTRFSRTIVRGMLLAAVGAGVVLGWSGLSAAAVVPPLVAQAGQLIAPGGVEEMAKPAKQLPAGAQKMADNFAKGGTGEAAAAPAAAAPAAPATAAISASLLKYAPSYVLMVLAVSLGLFSVCRPAGFSLAALTAKKEKKK